MREHADRFRPRHKHTKLVAEVFGLADTREHVADTRQHLSSLVQDELEYAKRHQPPESTKFAGRFQKDLFEILNLPSGYDVKFFTAGGTEASAREAVDGWVQVEDPSGRVMATFKMNLESDIEREKRHARGEVFYINEVDYKRDKSRFFLDKKSTYAYMLEKASVDLAHQLRREGVEVHLPESTDEKIQRVDVSSGSTPVYRRRRGGATPHTPSPSA